jgi:hypothetical protein
VAATSRVPGQGRLYNPKVASLTTIPAR